MEGVGGWWFFLSESIYLLDVVVKLNMEVILVVGMKLGCFNYVFLMVEVIIYDGFNIKGWVVNDIIGEMLRYKENLVILKYVLFVFLLFEVFY